MRKFFIIACFLFSSFRNKPFTGYLVCKEHTPAHMSNQSPKTISYAAVFRPVIIPHSKPNPHKISEKYTWYIANKYSVREFAVSKTLFHSKKLGQKVTM